jgi:hypothetical protein
VKGNIPLPPSDAPSGAPCPPEGSGSVAAPVTESVELYRRS